MITPAQKVTLTRSELESLEDWLSTLPRDQWDRVVITEGEPNGIGSTIVAYATGPGHSQGWFKEISNPSDW